MSVAIGSETERKPDLDRTFEILSHRHRRWLLSFMMKYDKETIPVSTAVKAITVLDTHASPESVYKLLMHKHLRRMDRAGMIEFNATEEQITYTAGPHVEEFITNALDWDPQFSES